MKKEEGFSTLLIVIILGSVALGLALWLSAGSFWSVRSSIDNRLSAQAKTLVNACAEVALETMRENNSYIGSGSQTIGGNTCNYTVNNAGGNSRSVFATGSVGAITRKIQIATSAFNPLTIDLWQEIP